MRSHLNETKVRCDIFIYSLQSLSLNFSQVVGSPLLCVITEPQVKRFLKNADLQSRISQLTRRDP